MRLVAAICAVGFAVLAFSMGIAALRAAEFVPSASVTGTTKHFYELREFAPAWSGSPAALRDRTTALAALRRAADDGLAPGDYAVAPDADVSITVAVAIGARPS